MSPFSPTVSKCTFTLVNPLSSTNVEPVFAAFDFSYLSTLSNEISFLFSKLLFSSYESTTESGVSAKGAYTSDLIRGLASSLFAFSTTKLSCLNTGFNSFFHSPCLLFSKGSGIGISGITYPSDFSDLDTDLNSLTRGCLSGTCFMPISGSKSFFLRALSTS